MKVLLTGGAGYIGSHTLLELIKKSFDVTVVDNLVNSSFEALKRVQLIAGKHINFLPMDLLDKKEINNIKKEKAGYHQNQMNIIFTKMKIPFNALMNKNRTVKENLLS